MDTKCTGTMEHRSVLVLVQLRTGRFGFWDSGAQVSPSSGTMTYWLVWVLGQWGSGQS